MLVEPKPDMKHYMYLYRLVVLVISIAFFPHYACIHLIVCVSLLFLFHFSLDTLTPYALHATPHNYQVLIIQGHAMHLIKSETILVPVTC